MISAVTLKTLGAFAVFVVSIAGFALPQYLIKNFGDSSSIESLVLAGRDGSPLFTYGFYVLKAFASGVIFGVAMVHLLVDALESLQTYSSFPIAPCVIGLGVFLSIGMDQIAHHWMKTNQIRASKKGLKLPSSSSSKASALSRPKGLEMAAFTAGAGSRYDDVEDGPGGESSHSSDWLDPPTFTVPDSIEKDHNVKLYVIEIAIAVHSVIIGFGFGATDTSRGTDIEVLMLAFCFHQFFEGIGLSVAVSHSSLDVAMVAKFGVFFAVTFPIGVMIGIFSSVSDSQQLLQGIANALAAGILIQASLVEMIAVDFSDERLNGFFLLKSLMFFGLVAGFVAMSSLALLE